MEGSGKQEQLEIDMGGMASGIEKVKRKEKYSWHKRRKAVIIAR